MELTSAIWYSMSRILMVINISLINTELSFKKFTKLLNNKSHCVMEVTGYYHYQLAYHLLESYIKVSVENLLSVKRFIQMGL